MLQIDMTVNGKKYVAKLMVVRGDQHIKLRNSFWYHYQADYEDPAGGTHRYLGKVLHNYDHGAMALTQKVTKAIVAQQKAAKVAS